jgi:hypothetical protein
MAAERTISPIALQERVQALLFLVGRRILETMGWMFDHMQDAMKGGESTALVAGAAVTIVAFGVVTKLARSFKRDSSNTFSNAVTGSVSILSNKDSVLKRDQVQKSMDGYDNLFAGARTNVGSLHEEASIKKREKEYKTMVNSFYDLVTDFYEWGWGQVSFLRHWMLC